MGQKIHPNGLRIGIIRTWKGRWYAPKGKYQQYLHEDISLREFAKSYLAHAMVSKVEIERTPQRVKVNIHTARPGVVIGRKGAEVNDLRKGLQKLTDKMVDINIHEVKNAAIDAQLITEAVGAQLQKRVAFRRAMRKAVQDALRSSEVQGIKIQCKGRLGGSEIARVEWYREGRVPLHTLRANIDYGLSHIETSYGVIGVKVWVFTHEVLPEGKVRFGGSVREGKKTVEVVPLNEG